MYSQSSIQEERALGIDSRHPGRPNHPRSTSAATTTAYINSDRGTQQPEPTNTTASTDDLLLAAQAQFFERQILTKERAAAGAAAAPVKAFPTSSGSPATYAVSGSGPAATLAPPRQGFKSWYAKNKKGKEDEMHYVVGSERGDGFGFEDGRVENETTPTSEKNDDDGNPGLGYGVNQRDVVKLEVPGDSDAPFPHHDGLQDVRERNLDTSEVIGELMKTMPTKYDSGFPEAQHRSVRTKGPSIFAQRRTQADGNLMSSSQVTIDTLGDTAITEDKEAEPEDEFSASSLVDQMSPSEREEAIHEITNMFSQETLDFLRSRAAAKASTKQQVVLAPVSSDEPKTSSDKLVSFEKSEDIQSKPSNRDLQELDSEWMKPSDVSTLHEDIFNKAIIGDMKAFGEAAFWRFDFEGKRLDTAISDSIDPYQGLHHHGFESHLPGYTLSELHLLMRSAFAPQRAMALQTIARIFAGCELQDHSELRYSHQPMCLILESKHKRGKMDATTKPKASKHNRDCSDHSRGLLDNKSYWRAIWSTFFEMGMHKTLASYHSFKNSTPAVSYAWLDCATHVVTYLEGKCSLPEHVHSRAWPEMNSENVSCILLEEMIDAGLVKNLILTKETAKLATDLPAAILVNLNQNHAIHQQQEPRVAETSSASISTNVASFVRGSTRRDVLAFELAEYPILASVIKLSSKALGLIKALPEHKQWRDILRSKWELLSFLSKYMSEKKSHDAGDSSNSCGPMEYNIHALLRFLRYTLEPENSRELDISNLISIVVQIQQSKFSVSMGALESIRLLYASRVSLTDAHHEDYIISKLLEIIMNLLSRDQLTSISSHIVVECMHFIEDWISGWNTLGMLHARSLVIEITKGLLSLSRSTTMFEMQGLAKLGIVLPICTGLLNMISAFFDSMIKTEIDGFEYRDEPELGTSLGAFSQYLPFLREMVDVVDQSHGALRNERMEREGTDKEWEDCLIECVSLVSALYCHKSSLDQYGLSCLLDFAGYLWELCCHQSNAKTNSISLLLVHACGFNYSSWLSESLTRSLKDKDAPDLYVREKMKQVVGDGAKVLRNLIRAELDLPLIVAQSITPVTSSSSISWKGFWDLHSDDHMTKPRTDSMTQHIVKCGFSFSRHEVIQNIVLNPAVLEYFGSVDMDESQVMDECLLPRMLKLTEAAEIKNNVCVDVYSEWMFGFLGDSQCFDHDSLLSSLLLSKVLMNMDLIQPQHLWLKVVLFAGRIDIEEQEDIWEEIVAVLKELHHAFMAVENDEPMYDLKYLIPPTAVIADEGGNVPGYSKAWRNRESSIGVVSKRSEQIGVECGKAMSAFVTTLATRGLECPDSVKQCISSILLFAMMSPTVSASFRTSLWVLIVETECISNFFSYASYIGGFDHFLESAEAVDPILFGKYLSALCNDLVAKDRSKYLFWILIGVLNQLSFPKDESDSDREDSLSLDSENFPHHHSKQRRRLGPIMEYMSTLAAQQRFDILYDIAAFSLPAVEHSVSADEELASGSEIEEGHSYKEQKVGGNSTKAAEPSSLSGDRYVSRSSSEARSTSRSVSGMFDISRNGSTSVFIIEDPEIPQDDGTHTFSASVDPMVFTERIENIRMALATQTDNRDSNVSEEWVRFVKMRHSAPMA